MKRVALFFSLFFAIALQAQQQEMCKPERIQVTRSAYDTTTYILEGKQDSIIQACLQDFNADTLRHFIQQLQSFQTRFLFADNRREVSVWIRDRFLQYGCDEAVLDSFYLQDIYLGDTLEGWQYNVIGTLYGSRNAELECLMGGHLDAIVWNNGNSFIESPGADDNGTAIAACMESLRVFKKHGFRPPTTVRFTGWAAEEMGLYGSRLYAHNASIAGTKIKLYVNMDMIGTDTGTTNYNVVIFQYDNCKFGSDICSYICENHTLLNPMVIPYNAQGSDSYSFWEAGLPAVYYEEYEFSPVYHTPADVDTNMNFAYFRETAAASCGTLMWSTLSPSQVIPTVANPGNGSSLILQWHPVPEQDLAHYNIYVGLESGTYTQLYTTTDTTFEVSGLMTDSTYYLAVSAENSGGMQGILSEVSDIPTNVTFEHALLIVEDSQGAEPSVPDSLVRQFYEQLGSKYDYAFYQAFDADKITLTDLGKYKAVLWNVNKSMENTVLNRSQRDVKHYLNLGGKILFTLYTPSRAFNNNTDYPADFNPGDYMYDYGKTDTAWHSTGSACIGAYPVEEGYPPLPVDTNKVSEASYHHLVRIEGLIPTEGTKIIYRYDTEFDTTSKPGKMKHKPVGIEYLGDDFNMIMTSLPLYYIEQEKAGAFVDFVMKEKFGIYPYSIKENPAAGRVTLRPNPANDRVEISVNLPESSRIRLTLVNLLGQHVMTIRPVSGIAGINRIQLETTGLRPGLYTCIVDTDNMLFKEKLIIAK